MTTPEQAKGHCPFNPEEPTPMHKTALFLYINVGNN